MQSKKFTIRVFLFLLLSGVYPAAVAELSADQAKLIQRDLEKSISPFNGPNCHNSALIVLGLTKVRRFVSADEMKNVIFNSGQCTAVPRSEPGAVRLLFQKRNGAAANLIHSQVVVRNNAFFEKAGLRVNERFQIADNLATQRAFTKGKPICEGQNSSACDYYALYFTCQPNSNRDEDPLEDLEAGWSDWYQRGSQVSAVGMRKNLAGVNAGTLTPSDAIRLQSILTQIDFLTVPPEVPPSMR